MSVIDSLTPKNTEEIKPGLFIQTTARGFKQIYPAAWNGKINWKNLLIGPGFFKSFIFFAIIMFLVWSYSHDVETYKNFYEEVSSNPEQYCREVSWFDVGDENPITIPGYNGKDSFGIIP